MQSISIVDTQQVQVTAQPLDAANQDATNFNTATWAVTDTTVANVTGISADGLTATVVAVGVGTTTITVTGQQGNFLPTYSTPFSVTITPGLPTQFSFTFGTPENIGG